MILITHPDLLGSLYCTLFSDKTQASFRHCDQFGALFQDFGIETKSGAAFYLHHKQSEIDTDLIR